METTAIIKIRTTEQTKKVAITSDNKPDVFFHVAEKWQSLIDLAASIVNVPSGLIMKLNENTIEVFKKSNTEGNPYEEGEKADLVYGLYCETVIGTQCKLIVPDATKDPVWSFNNPDIDIDMISYLGYPINWPDGEVFGTVCLLDNKENAYNQTASNLMLHLKQHIETDLQLLLTNKHLEEVNVLLQNANATKDKFFSIIAHDLRSPFSALLSLSEMLVRNYNNYEVDKHKEFLGLIYNSADQTYKLLENLLLWANSQRGSLEYNIEKIDIASIAKENKELLKQTSDNKYITIKNDVAENSFVWADSNFTSTIIRNLISNAIKFTPTGGEIILSNKIIIKENKKAYLEFSVTDNGIGMNDETKLNLFSTAKQTSRDGTNNETGTGLGLILSKDFVEKQGGEIYLESIEGKGSTFSFTLPLATNK